MGPKDPGRPGQIIVRNAAWGGAAGVNVGMFLAVSFAGMTFPNDVAMVVLLPSIFGMGVAGAATIASLLLHRRTKGMAGVESELLQAAALLERGLIDAEDYHRVKTKTLEDYYPGRAELGQMIRRAFFIGLCAMALPMFILVNDWAFTLDVLIAAGVGLVAGSVLAGGLTGAHLIANRQKARWPASQVEGVTERRMLGGSDYSQERPK